MKIIKPNGDKITWKDALKRHLLDFADLGLYGIPALICVSKTPKHQRLGDLWANTMVVLKSDITENRNTILKMLKQETYTISGAKGKLISMDLTLLAGNRHAPLVIFAHGFKGFKDWGSHHLMARHFAECGFRFLKFNFSHNGVTADKPTEFTDMMAFADNTFSMELEDLGHVISFACGGAALPAAKTVMLIGHSMGGGISIIKAAEDKRIAKLITMASISGFGNLWPKEAEAQWRLQGTRYVLNARTGQQMPIKASLLTDLDLNAQRLDILARAAEVAQPWLLVHGDQDTSVPLSHAHQLKAAQPNAELLIIPGADHVFGSAQPWLADTMPPHLLEFCNHAVSFLQS